MAKEPDSIIHTRDRRAKLKAGAEEEQLEQEIAEEERKEKQADRDRKSRDEEDRLLTKHAGLVQEGETRDHLLERIRQMRQDKSTEPPPPPPLTEYMQKQLTAEQEAGAAAVKRAEEELERNREARRKAAEEQIKREGTMEAVHHPNPGMNEQFPAQNATLGKTKK